MTDKPAPPAVVALTQVTVRSTSPTTPSGDIVAALLDAPSVGIVGAYLCVAPQRDEITLVAPCGCSVSVPLSTLVRGLALRLANHPPAVAAGDAATDEATVAAALQTSLH